MPLLRICVFLLFLCLAVVSPSMGGPLTPQEKHGKEIYFKGTSPSGREIKAFLGIASVEARVVILHPSRKDLDEVIDSAIESAKERKWNRVSKMEYSPDRFEGRGIMETLRKENVDIVLFLGIESEVSGLLKEGKGLNWSPYLLLPGVLAGRGIYSIPSNFKDKVILAYPTLPEDRKERGMQALGALARKYSLPATPPTAQISAYAAVQILLEGLRRTGRELSRERFVSTLERMYEFDTGLTPPITYGPNRHIGAMGAYVVTVDPDKEGTKDFISSRKWVTVD